MPVMRFLSDSVGIRTQDPQLRRLLLYPTELPNRSDFAFDITVVLMSKVAAKIVIIFGFAIECFYSIPFLLKVMGVLLVFHCDGC